jgi:hypothetical protein
VGTTELFRRSLNEPLVERQKANDLSDFTGGRWHDTPHRGKRKSSSIRDSQSEMACSNKNFGEHAKYLFCDFNFQ